LKLHRGLDPGASGLVLASTTAVWFGGLSFAFFFFGASGSNVSLLIKAFLTYCLHTGTILEGDLALQIVAGFGIVNGLGGMFAPDLVAKLPWDGSASPATCAGVGAAVYALTTGASATQAFAYSVVPALVQSLQGIGDSDDMGKLVTLIQAAVVATNLA